jgi:Tol biopolymer transport system component
VNGGHAESLLSGFRFDEPQVSPDGRWLTYVSRESGKDEVYLEPFRREGTRVRVSPSGGGQPKWRGDGRELFFTTPTNNLMAVAVRTESDRVDVSLPTDLFEIRTSNRHRRLRAERRWPAILVKTPTRSSGGRSSRS